MRTLQHSHLSYIVLIAGIFCSGCLNNNNHADGSGTIECTQVNISPQVSGYIQKLYYDEGDNVKKGGQVLKINPQDYILRVNQARASLNLASNQLALILAGSRIEDIEAAKEKVREARAVADGAESDLKRIEQVFNSGSATEKQLDDARTAAERSRAIVAAAEQTLARLKAGARKEEIDVAQSQVELARTRLAQEEKALSDCDVYSPLNGVVTTKIHEQGEFVMGSTSVLTVSELDEVWLSVYVPEPHLSGVKIGQEAYVKVDGHNDVFKGLVSFISPEAEFTPRNVQTPEERAKLVYRVKITINNTNRILKPGMPADGYFHNPQIKTNGSKSL